MATTSSLPNVAVRKNKSSCCHAEEIIDVIVITLIFNRGAMEKTNPPYPCHCREGGGDKSTIPKKT